MNDPSAEPSDACLHCGLPVPSSRRKRGGDAAGYCCLGCHLVHQMVRAGESDRDGPAAHPLLLRLGLGIFLAMNIMAFSGFFYSQQVYGAAGEINAAGSMLASMFSYLLLLLCTLVILILGGPLISETVGGWRSSAPSNPTSRWAFRVDVNALILIGVLAAYGLSAINTFRGQGHLYYDTSAMILVLVTLGGYLDARAKRKAAASGEALLSSLPARVHRRQGDDIVEVETDAIKPDDVVRVLPGETIALDGEVVQGMSHVNESILTGESRPRAVSPGDRALGGAMNVDGLLWIRISAAQGERVIDQVKRLLEEARRKQPAIQRVADHVATMFVPFVMLLAAGVFAFHAMRGDPGEGLFTALSVLLISCPCALGLAAPLACYSALNRAARHGILIDSPVTLERLANVGTVLFDKTGTLTRGCMTVDHITTAPGISQDEALSLAATIESATNHPIAQAIVTHAASRGLAPGLLQQASVLPGLGMEAWIEGRRLLLGNPALARREGYESDALLPADESGTQVLLMEGGRILAQFALADEVRPEARGVLASLRSLGMKSSVLTGDASVPARRLAEQIDIDVQSGLLPADKVTRMEQVRRESGGRVAFVGDGINDAPVMGAADVGIAAGGATDLARQAGHVHLIGNGLHSLPRVFEIARDAVRRVRLNLIWAFGYNTIGLTLATLGLLSPIFAASSMVVSSLLIVWTSGSAASGPRRATDEPDASDFSAMEQRKQPVRLLAGT